MFGLTVTAAAQDTTPAPQPNSTNQSSQSAQTPTTSSTDTTTAPANQNNQTDTTSKKSSTDNHDQTTSTDSTGSTSTKKSTTMDQSSSSSRNRTVDTDKSMIGEKDHRFLSKASEGGLMEVQMAQAAQQKASSQAVKDYAKQLEQDHTAANKQLSDIATQRNVSLPTTPMASDHQQAMDKLNKLSGAEFDKQYIKMMIKDHRKDIKEFESEANNGMDSSLKNFASSALPTLRNHLQMAEQIDKGGSATSTKTASTTTETVSESSRSRSKGATVTESDKSTINKTTPAPADVSTTQVDRTTTNPDGTVKQDQTTINKVTTKP